MSGRSPSETPRWQVILLLGLVLAALALFASRAAAHLRLTRLDQAQIELRLTNLAQLRIANRLALETPAWIDRSNNVVRLPIQRAMELTARQWQDPAAGRSNLLMRLDKATAPPPELVNPYE
jgi:hypothetical protein